MHFYNIYQVLALLCFFPFCLHPMKRSNIEDGIIVKKRTLSYQQEEELKHLHNVDLNIEPTNNDYTTEDESETTETAEALPQPPQNPLKIVVKLTQKQVSDLVYEIIETKNPKEKKAIRNIFKKHGLSPANSLKKYDNTLFLGLTPKDFEKILKTSNRCNLSIEQAYNNWRLAQNPTT